MQSLDVISVNLWQILISLCNLLILYLILKQFLYPAGEEASWHSGRRRWTSNMPQQSGRARRRDARPAR